MDIDLLSKMVKELILDNDKVVLPGLGAFVAEVVPSTFSDKGYTINPPYRKLYFRAKPDEDTALIDFYATSNRMDRDIADKVIRDFVSELKDVLFTRKTVVFPGLGRMRATKENHVFFIADEELDIYPEGFALEPVSLKTHVETKEEVHTVMQELKAIVEESPVPEAEIPVFEEVFPVEPPVEVPVEAPVEAPVETPVELPPVTPDDYIQEQNAANPDEQQGPEAAAEPEAEGLPEEVADTALPAVAATPKKRSFWKPFFRTVLILLLVIAFLLAAFVVFARYMPDVADRLLYTPEELEILHR